MAGKKDDSTKVEEAKTTKGVEAEKPDEAKVAEAETKPKEEETDTSEQDEPAEQPFKKRFTQFKGETPEEYAPQLEDAYANLLTEFDKYKKSTQETEATETVAPTIQDDSDEDDGSGLSADDRALINDAKAERERQDLDEYNKFVEQHPEIESDPGVREKVLAELKTLAIAEKVQGRRLRMEVGLRRAWNNVTDSSEEETRQGIKSATASSKNTSGGKAKVEDGITDGELKTARKMLDPTGTKSDAELRKELAASKK